MSKTLILGFYKIFANYLKIYSLLEKPKGKSEWKVNCIFFFKKASKFCTFINKTGLEQNHLKPSRKIRIVSQKKKKNS